MKCGGYLYRENGVFRNLPSRESRGVEGKSGKMFIAGGAYRPMPAGVGRISVLKKAKWRN